jgi:hypothetical protein
MVPSDGWAVDMILGGAAVFDAVAKSSHYPETATHEIFHS